MNSLDLTEKISGDTYKYVIETSTKTPETPIPSVSLDTTIKIPTLRHITKMRNNVPYGHRGADYTKIDSTEISVKKYNVKKVQDSANSNLKTKTTIIK